MFDGSGTDGYQRRNSRFSFSSCKKLLKRNGRQWQNEQKRVEILTSFKYAAMHWKKLVAQFLFIRFRLLGAQIACFDWVEWACNDIKIQFSLERGDGQLNFIFLATVFLQSFHLFSFCWFDFLPIGRKIQFSCSEFPCKLNVHWLTSLRKSIRGGKFNLAASRLTWFLFIYKLMQNLAPV